MKEFFEKLTDIFLFDILGLMLPGFIFMMILMTPFLLIDFSQIDPAYIYNSKIFSMLKLISDYFSLIEAKKYFLVILLITSYLLGHSIKVLSIQTYKILETIFDKTINPLISYLISKINLSGKKVLKPISERLSPIKIILLKLFTFQSEDYFKDNEELRTRCIEIINTKLRTTFPDVWYSLYKFAVVTNAQEGLKSLSYVFLAKYNLYRSLSFIFIMTFIYYIFFFQVAHDYLSKNILNLYNPILSLIFILWFTFHEKYKRYWTLCGNEALMSLFYFLNRKHLKKT